MVPEVGHTAGSQPSLCWHEQLHLPFYLHHGLWKLVNVEQGVEAATCLFGPHASKNPEHGEVSPQLAAEAWAT